MSTEKKYSLGKIVVTSILSVMGLGLLTVTGWLWNFTSNSKVEDNTLRERMNTIEKMTKKETDWLWKDNERQDGEIKQNREVVQQSMTKTEQMFREILVQQEGVKKDVLYIKEKIDTSERIRQ